MASEAELDVLVEKAIETLSGQSEKITSRSVKNLVRHRAEDVLLAYQRYTNRQKAERKAELSRAISPGIAAEIIKDREVYSESKTQLIKEEVEQLQVDCEVLNEEIVELRNELAEAQELTKKRQVALTEQIDELQRIKTEQEGEVKSLLGENRVLRTDRGTARKERTEIEIKLSGLKQTLAVKASDERRERTRAKSLQAKLDKTELEKEQFRETNDELIKKLEKSQDQLSSEQKERAEAENMLLDAETCIDGLKDEINRLQKIKTSTKSSRKTSTDNK